MDKITTLAISYPDFQLNQIIDPEQMDLNNLQIVNKINNVIKSFNELIQGTSGAGNITIAPIPEFSDAKTVQQALQQIATFVKTLDADAKRQFAELVQKNSQQDTEIQSIKSVNTRQDSRLQSLESTQTNHTQRIGAIEQKNTSQDDEINAIKQKNSEQDGRLSSSEGTIRTHTSQISKIQEKDVEQDRRISGIESREELDTAFVTKIEKRVGVNETDIQKLQEDFAQLEGKDPVAELVVARTSGHTQETFRTLGDRLDHNEIPVKTDFTGKLRGAVNFRIVDENTTETWENHVKLGDITTHDESPIAHEVMMAEHEMDETSHSDIREKIATHEASGTSHNDIREKIATHETSGTSHSDIREKIIGLGEKDLELDKKINASSEKRRMITYTNLSHIGCSESSMFSEIVKAMESNSRLIFSSYATLSWFPSGLGSDFNDIEVTRYGGGINYVKVKLHTKNSGMWYGNYSEQYGLTWKQLATTDKTEILLLNGYEVVDSGRDELIVTRSGNICNITGRIVNKTTAPNGIVVGVVDEQYRPKKYRRAYVYYEPNKMTVQCEIKPNGDIIIYDYEVTSNSNIRINITYNIE